LEHHQKLEDHFSGFLFTLFLMGAQIIERLGGLIIFLSKTDEKSRFLVFGLLFKIKETQISQSLIRDRLFLHHASWFSFLFYRGHTLKSLRGLFIHVKKLLLAFCLSEWRLQRKQIPENFGFFSTFWTTMVENPSFSEWHFD
jgi:hypothetical protein